MKIPPLSDGGGDNRTPHNHHFHSDFSFFFFFFHNSNRSPWANVCSAQRVNRNQVGSAGTLLQMGGVAQCLYRMQILAMHGGGGQSGKTGTLGMCMSASEPFLGGLRFAGWSSSKSVSQLVAQDPTVDHGAALIGSQLCGHRGDFKI